MIERNNILRFQLSLQMNEDKKCTKAYEKMVRVVHDGQSAAVVDMNRNENVSSICFCKWSQQMLFFHLDAHFVINIHMALHRKAYGIN